MALCLWMPGAMPDSSAGAGGKQSSAPKSGLSFPPRDEDPDYRCALLTRLIEGGLNLGGGIGRQVLAEIVRPHVTVLELAGDALLPGPALRFLLEELPDTARMINFYENTRYEVAWLTQDRSRFIATNNRTLQATFKRFKTRTTDGAGDYLLFESGSARLLFWQLNGATIVGLHLEPGERATRYNIKIHIFTDSPESIRSSNPGFSDTWRGRWCRGLSEIWWKRQTSWRNQGMRCPICPRVLQRRSGRASCTARWGLLDGHRFGQVAGFVNIGPLDESDVVSQKAAAGWYRLSVKYCHPPAPRG